MTTTPKDEHIARNILEQLGGMRFLAMTGARIMIIENGLQVDFPGCRVANKCRIVLAPDDTYTMKFYKYSRKTGECPEVESYEWVHDFFLTTIFRAYTGLDVTL